MKFYNRENELKELEQLFRQTKNEARMTVLTGRRRVGKTMLSMEFANKHKYLYLFISKKDELLLCREFIDEIKNKFNIPVVGEILNFKDIFKLLLELSTKERYILIIDEFQEFYNINKSVYSDIQNLWDTYKKKSKLHLVFVGSVYSLIHKIFKDSKEPLFGRADRFIVINPFELKTLKHILDDHKSYTAKNIFDYFIITGSLPRYIDLLISNSVFNFNNIIDFILKPNSPFIDEGKHLLIEEFGKEYNTYFSILELISLGKTARPEIESILQKATGGYLDRLENDYGIIKKFLPFDSKPGSRVQKYKIADNFLNFWFRFIYRNRSAVETANFQYVKNIVKRDYQTFSGLLLESFFHQLFAESYKYNKIGSYWEKGNKNEIDIVAVNDIKEKAAYRRDKIK